MHQFQNGGPYGYGYGPQPIYIPVPMPPPGPGGLMPPNVDWKEMNKAQRKYAKQFAKMQEEAKKLAGGGDKKDDKKSDDKKVSWFTRAETFFLLVLLSPIIGPLYTFMLTSSMKAMMEQFSNILK